MCTETWFVNCSLDLADLIFSSVLAEVYRLFDVR